MSLPLTIRELTVRAGGRVLLDVPELDVSAGQSVGISGPSGAGKSTLLFAMAGLLDAVQGQVCWGSKDLGVMTAAQRSAFRATQIGMVFQDFLLFDELGPLANAALPSLFAPRAWRGGIVNTANRALDRLGVPKGARNVASFSGGERQRVAVARALATDAPVVLADEPTASLDRQAADALISDVVALSRDRGKTLVVVSHDPALLDRMDRVLTLCDGALS